LLSAAASRALRVATFATNAAAGAVITRAADTTPRAPRSSTSPAFRDCPDLICRPVQHGTSDRDRDHEHPGDEQLSAAASLGLHRPDPVVPGQRDLLLL
jgi:hypothetical protein